VTGLSYRRVVEPDVDPAALRASLCARLRADARGGDGGVREELAKGIGRESKVVRVRITDAGRKALREARA
jgi:hypothetical protein